MDHKNAVALLEETFEQEFVIDRFANFIKELFNHFNISIRDVPLWKEYYDYVETVNSLGVYRDSDKRSIEVFTIKLKRTRSRDRARTMQRNLVARYLTKFNLDAALVAFYGDDPEDWRLSFVKMEYELTKDEKGNLKVTEELTPARRYSFLVGKNEPNHTCKLQFLGLIKEETTDPLLTQIEETFSIEKVTKEFFSEYKELYLKLKESLEKSIENDEVILQEFENKVIKTSDFAKKLMGQIVFIYFLQKKGWLGVEKGRDWGTGPKKFLRKLFNGEIVEYDNFFNDVLEHLFYDALSSKHDGDYYDKFECKIPFLNGGLFEPINDYDWRKTDIQLNNDIFKEILDTFDLYNFTVKEDEPLEKEVAVDPEMLGKVFENLLEIEDRKSKGAFYTPREIVHYMCQESLINYLNTNSKLDKEDIDNFIRLGDVALGSIIKEQEQIKKYKKSYEKPVLPASIQKNHKDLDKLLKEIKIVDPSVGSGAFPVGMMNEIIKARTILSLYSKKNVTNYDLKLETIENCLYGVDIDSSAVDIAKLRFWLSLIVDEEKVTTIDPLPNLDHKIMCGDSLIEEFEGKKLFDDNIMFRIPEDYSEDIRWLQIEIDNFHKELGEILTGKDQNEDRKNIIQKEIKKLQQKKKKIKKVYQDNSEQFTLDENFNNRVQESHLKLKKLKTLQKFFFKEQNHKLKKSYREEIDQLEWQLIEETLKEEGNDAAIAKLSEYKINKSKPFFIWKINFPEVFLRENPGFDIVIANPPYVEFKNLEKNIKNVLEKSYVTTKGKYDLYIPFFEKSEYLSRNNGFITFICPTRFMHRDYGKDLRKFITESFLVNEIIDFGDDQVFEGATNYTGIFSFIKKENTNDEIFYYKRLKSMDIPEKSNFARLLLTKFSSEHIEVIEINNNTLNEEVWYFNTPQVTELFKKIFKGSDHLIDISEGIFQGIASGKDPVFIIDKKIVNSYRIEPEIIYPFLKGKDISRYSITWKDKYVIYPYDDDGNVIDEKNLKVNFPNAYQYLIENREKLKGRAYFDKSNKKWYELWNQRKLKRFKQTKIITLDNAKENSFALDNNNFIGTTTVYSIILKSKSVNDYIYTLALLNSKLLNFYHKKNTIPQRGGFFRYQALFIKNLPIKRGNIELKTKIIDLATKLIDVKKTNKSDNNEKKINNELDNVIFELYELTSDEISIINQNVGGIK